MKILLLLYMKDVIVDILLQHCKHKFVIYLPFVLIDFGNATFNRIRKDICWHEVHLRKYVCLKMTKFST